MKQPIMINSRQIQVLNRLLASGQSLSIEQMADMHHVSTRTIQRDLKAIRKWIGHFQMRIEYDRDHFIYISADENSKKRLRQFLSEQEVVRLFTPEERQRGIVVMLLLSKEPVKTYALSRKYGVTESTISQDLNKIEEWLEPYGLQVVRKPGLGVYLDGTEAQIRFVLSDVLHQNISMEKWLEMFSFSIRSKEAEHISDNASHPLTDLIDIHDMIAIEKAVSRTLKEESGLHFSDRNYVNLIVHIAIAVQRLKNGESIRRNEEIVRHYQQLKEYPLALKIADSIKAHLDIRLPELEVTYIALHLYGAQIDPSKVQDDDDEMLKYMDIVRSLVRGVENVLEKPFSDDEVLVQGLLTHLIPAINRIQMGLQIRNPMLAQIRRKYPEIFQACKQAALFVENKIGFAIPDEEIGYIAMHFGAALLRGRDRQKIDYSALVVCASGIGTGQFLASRIRKEIPYIEVREVVSALRVKEWIRLNGEVDIIISTVPLPHVQSSQTLIVSPFLNEKDLELIREKLKDSSLRKVTRQLEKQQDTNMLLSIARYGEAVTQILRNFDVIENVPSPSLAEMMQYLNGHPSVRDLRTLYHDLKKREEKGGFVLSGLGMIHAKTEGVSELMAAVFRLSEEADWKGTDGEAHRVQTVLLLAAPHNAPREHLETISEISAALIEDRFITCLCHDANEAVKTAMEKMLTGNYMLKTEQIHKGN